MLMKFMFLYLAQIPISQVSENSVVFIIDILDSRSQRAGSYKIGAVIVNVKSVSQ